MYQVCFVLQELTTARVSLMFALYNSAAEIIEKYKLRVTISFLYFSFVTPQ